MKITDLKCAVIASSPVIRITTDEGITGWGQIETPKPYLQPIVLQLKSWLVGQDPVNVERVMRRIRVRGGFKPFGSAVSGIEMALWDIAGKAAGLPVYRLLGGKVRDQAAHLSNAVPGHRSRRSTKHEVADYVRWARDRPRALPEKFTMLKLPSPRSIPRWSARVPDFFYNRAAAIRCAVPVPEPRRADRNRVPAFGGVHNGGQGNARAEIWHGRRCRAWLHRLRCFAFREGAGAAASAVGRGHDHRRLRSVRQSGRVSRGDAVHDHADPYRGADLSAAEFQAADRKPRGQRHRPRPLRRRRHRRTEMDRRIRRPARHRHGAAWLPPTASSGWPR